MALLLAFTRAISEWSCRLIRIWRATAVLTVAYHGFISIWWHQFIDLWTDWILILMAATTCGYDPSRVVWSIVKPEWITYTIRLIPAVVSGHRLCFKCEMNDVLHYATTTLDGLTVAGIAFVAGVTSKIFLKWRKFPKKKRFYKSKFH